MSTSPQNLIDFAEFVYEDSLAIKSCGPADPMCRQPEPLADQWVDVTNPAASTFTVPNGTFLVELKADAAWTHEGFELIWGPPGPRVCGDGALDLGYESCDDGNSVDGEPRETDAHIPPACVHACDPSCTHERSSAMLLRLLLSDFVRLGEISSRVTDGVGELQVTAALRLATLSRDTRVTRLDAIALAVETLQTRAARSRS